MYGQKQIISALLIVLLISILNFYKSIIKRDKDHREYTEQIKRKLLEEQALLDKENAEWEETQKLFRHKQFMTKMLEYNDSCHDIHALIFKPVQYDKIMTTFSMTSASSQSEITATAPTEINMTANMQLTNKKISEKYSGKQSSVVISSNGCNKKDSPVNGESEFTADISKTNRFKAKGRKIMDKISESSTSIIYFVLLVLLVSLGKAAFDLKKQFKELQKTKTLTEDELLRRCSLQEYSLIKHKQKQSTAKAPEPFKKKSIITQQLSLDSGAKLTEQHQHNLSRRISHNPEDYSNGSGITTEPGSPAKSGNLLAGRPVPLLRRCSVPTFANKNPGKLLRRPSMESFSEDEPGTPETRRRVRMLHRH